MLLTRNRSWKTRWDRRSFLAARHEVVAGRGLTDHEKRWSVPPLPSVRRRKAAVRPTKKGEEGGYALLFVLLMAAVIAISLYKQLPRVAFDTQRQKEQMLIERGGQYKRAIQIFLRTNNSTRWPATIDELESFNGKRYLRHRYKDPMTGKDVWRLVHIANGILTDSVLTRPKQTTDQTNATDQRQYLTQLASIGSQANQDNGQQNTSATNRRRASEGGAQLGPDGQPIPPTGTQPGGPGVPGAPTDPNAPGNSNTTANGSPFPPGIPGGMPGMPGLPGQIPGGQAGGGFQSGTASGTSSGNSSSSNSSSGSGYMSALPSMGSGSSSSTGGSAGAPVNSQVGGVSPNSMASGASGNAPGYGQPGMSISPQSQSAAAGLIGGLLTQPRPGGLSGLSGQAQGQVIGGGIAGVASKVKGLSIMVYGDRTDYSEWEFNWDPTKWAPPPNPNQSTVGTPMSQVASTAGSGATANTTTSNSFSANGATPNGSAFGAGNGTGTTSGFGNGSFSSGTTTSGSGNGGFSSGTTTSGSGNGGFSSGGSFNGTTTNGTTAGGTTPGGTGSQTSMSGFGAGGLPPSIRPGAP
jgi:hypothetical protein